MADTTFQDVLDQFDILQTAVTTEETDVTNYVAGLKAQIAAGSPVTPAQLDAFVTKQKGLTNMVSTFDLQTTAPPVVPAPLPPPAAKK